MAGSTGSRVPSMTAARPTRRAPIGAEYLGNNAAHFRVWAPAPRLVEVVIGGHATALEPEGQGYVSGTSEAAPGTRYRFRLDRGERLYPDPASRFQPDGPHGA